MPSKQEIADKLWRHLEAASEAVEGEPTSRPKERVRAIVPDAECARLSGRGWVVMRAGSPLAMPSAGRVTAWEKAAVALSEKRCPPTMHQVEEWRG